MCLWSSYRKIGKKIPSLGLNLEWLLLMLITVYHVGATTQEEKNFYIIYMGDHMVDQASAVEMHLNVLSAVKSGYGDASQSLVYSYTKSFNGFAARLSKDEADEISDMDGVISVFPNGFHQLHTTKSWDFIGLPLTAPRKLEAERDMIVGLLDTGIAMDAESFKDNGFGSPPSRWKGTCGRYANFSGCNNKVIGARHFKLDGLNDPLDILSPADVVGHGTHTSSTLAGNVVRNASLYGLAEGTARGAVPSARIAMYKVCWSTTGCQDMDILAGFDSAIHDGVDLISVSLGKSPFGSNYLMESIAIGSFHAMKRGILTVASAGNDGPYLSSLANHAPWLLTVASSGIDRGFRSKVSLGNGQILEGIGINGFEPKKKMYSLIHGAKAAKHPTYQSLARTCLDVSLDPSKIKGKIVFCDLSDSEAGAHIKRVGGAGIISDGIGLDYSQTFMIPGTNVNLTAAGAIHCYINSARSPTAVIDKSKEVKIPAPFIAVSSSRGPNPGSRNILKPDIAAPGIDILAAYTPLKSLTGLEGDTQFARFALMTGTSMACPHVAGVAAYVKSFHPDWSPSMIKSAIITTATPMSNILLEEAEFAYGSGQLNPSRARNPGLVYEANELSYIKFLCNEGFNGSQIGKLHNSRSINCSEFLHRTGQDALNYPTIQLSLNQNNNQTTTGIFKRRVTNVGSAVVTYNAIINAPPGVSIKANPMKLKFTRALQRKSFTVVIKVNPMPNCQIASGYLVWKSSKYLVRSPIVVHSYSPAGKELPCGPDLDF